MGRVDSLEELESAVLKILVSGGLLVLLTLWVQQGFPPPDQFHRSAPFVWFKSMTSSPVAEMVRSTLLHPIFWVGFGVILLLERTYPAKADQPTFSVGFAQDAVWFFVQPVLGAIITVTLATLLERVYRGYLSFLTIGALGQLPAWVLYAWAVLLTDFLKWFHHWLRHKVPALWEFHVVHHSQRQMNLFTDLRYHIVEYLVSRSVKTFPLLALAADAPTVYSFSLFHAWYTRLYHANIRTNLGPLRYILVTPQSHRVHHSIDPKHQDMNFGVLFTFWDWMFGTQYRGWSEYPDTGVADERFPHETTVRSLALLRTPIRQHLYPFLALYRKARREDRQDPSLLSPAAGPSAD